MNLYNGVEIPLIGIGPGIPPIKGGRGRSIFNRIMRKFIHVPMSRQRHISAVASAIKVGFRLIDFSSAYGDCGLITRGILKSGIARDKIFLTGRISNPAQYKGVTSVRGQIDEMLRRYETNCVDLLMFHWPVTGHYEDTWKVICEAYDAGKARSIGVANCHRHHLEELMKCGLKPMVNQFEVHPLFTQNDLVKYCQDLSIIVESYTAIARFDDRLMRLPALHRIAQSHGKSPVQVVLRWHVQRGCVPIVRSLNNVRQKEDVDIFDFQLSDDEMQTISGFNINSRLRYDPDNCDFSIL